MSGTVLNTAYINLFNLYDNSNFICFFNKFFKEFYLFIFRQRERGRETSSVSCLHIPPTGGHNPGMCPDQELNQRPFGLQAGAQSTEPFQPGHVSNFIDTTTTTAANNNDY